MSDNRNPEKEAKTTEQTVEAPEKEKKPEVKGKRLRTGAKGGAFTTWNSIFSD